MLQKYIQAKMMTNYDLVKVLQPLIDETNWTESELKFEKLLPNIQKILHEPNYVSSALHSEQ